MSQCTCTTDKEMTCIVHPTQRALKEYIARQAEATRELANDTHAYRRITELECDNALLRREVFHLTTERDSLRREMLATSEAMERLGSLEFAAQEVLDCWCVARPLEYGFSAQEWDAYRQLEEVMKDPTP